ncbi:MAG: hypothetical protein IJ645_08230 [Ruminococcus sp.]|nr:hypothetical protein [Ruminococcus sp.]
MTWHSMFKSIDLDAKDSSVKEVRFHHEGLHGYGIGSDRNFAENHEVVVFVK